MTNLNGGNDEQNTRRKERKKPEEPSPLFEYLKSEKGHELVSRIVAIIEDVKKVTLDRGAERAKLDLEFARQHRRNLLIQQSVIFGMSIVAASLLTYYDKFNSTIGVFFGTLVGYFLARRNMN
jgi:hypothetical protein